jgi:adenylate cyclase
MPIDKSHSKLAVLYADVSGSTRLYEQYGDVIARHDLSRCITLLANAAVEFGGTTLKTIGDEIMVAFVEPLKCALAAAEMQAGLRRTSEEGAYKMGILHIKIGWHYGSVAWRDNDLIGEAPITAQQIIKMAKADEILTSRQSVELLPERMFPDIHSIERVPAEAWNGLLEIYKMPWEYSGDETQISSKPRISTVMPQLAIVLEYDDQRVRVDTQNPSCSIGRGKQADLQVNGTLTSRQHAELTLRSGRFNLRDESTNGTFVVFDNGQRKHLRREEGVLTGKGLLGFGNWPADDPGGVVRFECSS